MFVGYPEDHTGDTHHTRKTHMPSDVKWMEWCRRQTAEDDLPLWKEVDQIKDHSIIINELPLTIPVMSTNDETFMEDISVQPPILANDNNILEDIGTVTNRRDLNTTTLILSQTPRTLELENQGLLQEHNHKSILKPHRTTIGV